MTTRKLTLKYLTPRWRRGVGSLPRGAASKYHLYLQSVRHRLPEAAWEFNSKHTLHDSQVRRIDNDLASKEVRLMLVGWDAAFQRRTRYRLVFSGVVRFDQQFPPQDNKPLGDCFAWEWEAKRKATELRMLFVSSALFRIVFENFSFEHARLRWKRKLVRA